MTVTEVEGYATLKLPLPHSTFLGKLLLRGMGKANMSVAYVRSTYIRQEGFNRVVPCLVFLAMTNLWIFGKRSQENEKKWGKGRAHRWAWWLAKKFKFRADVAQFGLSRRLPTLAVKHAIHTQYCALISTSLIGQRIEGKNKNNEG